MNCCRCGKSFDYEKHSGICPKCAAYNRPQGEKPYDYDVDKSFSSRYETMDDSHAKLHRMYDSASAHQPEKQHAEYHRQYDQNYKHPKPQGQGSAPAYRGNQPQMQGGIPNNRTYTPQGQGSAPAYRGNQPQGQGGIPNNRTYVPQGQTGGKPPQEKSKKNMVLKIFLFIVVIRLVISFLYAFYW